LPREVVELMIVQLQNLRSLVVHGVRLGRLEQRGEPLDPLVQTRLRANCIGQVVETAYINNAQVLVLLIQPIKGMLHGVHGW